MKRNFFKIVSIASLVSGILVVLLLVLATLLKPVNNQAGTVNRSLTSERLNQIKIENKEQFASKEFIAKLDSELNIPIISTQWIISEKGEILYAKGVMAQSTPVHTSVFALTGYQALGLIKSIEDNLDSTQKVMAYAAATIRNEGEHNDIYGHLVVPLKTKTNDVAGFLAVAYQLDESKPVNTAYYALIVALIICFVLYWLLLPTWVYMDCRYKNNNALLWSMFVLIGNLPALLAYLLSVKRQ